VTGPGRMLCTTCYRDLGTSRYDEAGDVWLYECPECPGIDGPLTLEVPGDRPAAYEPPDGGGIVAELGIHAALRTALGRVPGRWLEFAVVEHLYARTDPEAYQVLVERYGHVAIAPDTNTASWMIGRALWSLKRSNEVLVKGMPHGTGRWDYLAPCNAWALPGLTGNATLVTWEAFAEQEGFSPRSHPAIDWRDTPNAEPVATEPPSEPQPA
jgi:hypothetical protein